MSEQTMTVGTLGGPATFAGQATAVMLEQYSQLGEVSYFPSIEAVLEALAGGNVEAIILSEQTTRTGFGEIDELLVPPNSKIHVVAESVVPYGCSLLVKPGTRMSDIRGVLGHGSIRQCRRFLDENLPGVDSAIHSKNSVEAAREVATGDGSLAVVGTRKNAEMADLEILATDIDDGAAAAWWAMSLAPHFSQTPSRLVVGGRLGGDGSVGRLICDLNESGYTLRTLFSQPTGVEIFEHDYLLMLGGSGRLADVKRVLQGHKNARLVGAFEGSS